MRVRKRTAQQGDVQLPVQVDVVQERGGPRQERSILDPCDTRADVAWRDVW
jgi:hypothetical protein